MSLKVYIDRDLQKAMEAERRVAQKAITTGVRQTTNGLKTALRRQVRQSGLGKNLANAIRSKVKRKNGIADGMIYSKARGKRPGGRVDLITVFDQGAVIKTNGKRWLAIPLAPIGKIGNRRIRPSDYAKGVLAFLPTKNPAKAFLVFRRRGRPDEPAFLLLKQTQIAKRIDIDSALRAWLPRLPELIVDAWDKEKA